jgi:hypothetical protein
VKVRSRDLLVRVCAETDLGTYSFTCPQCGTAVVRDATPRILALLVSAGVHAVVWHQPAELLERRDGPPISCDDILDFHLGLERDDWFARLVESTGDLTA